MVDRGPANFRVEGRAVLIGDAARTMYPVGSNGASQGVVDARRLDAKLKYFGATRRALTEYQNSVLQGVNELILGNRDAGLIGILGIIEAIVLTNSISEIISAEEISDFISSYKTAAGFALDELNSSSTAILSYD
jgi:hypothetical protein